MTYALVDGWSPSKHKAVPWWKVEGVLQVAAALLYAVVATSMSFINRLSLLVFPIPTIILLGQMVATSAILYPLLYFNILTFPTFRWMRLRQLFGISALYTANTAFALFGLKSMNLPMYTAIKRLTPMTVLVIKSVWKKRWPHKRLTASVFMVVVGCVIAGAGDLSFDGWAYTFVLASVVMQSCYLLLVEFQGENAALSTSELLWYNALTSLPMLTLITAANGDFHIVAAAAATGMSMNGPLYFYFMVIAAATMGCLLNYSMFLCILHNSALSTTIVGVLRGVVTVLLGYVLDDVQFHVLNVLGLVLNTIGGVWYTYIKYMDKYCSGAKPTRSVVDSEKLSGSHKAAGAAANNDYSRRLQDMRDAVHFHAAEAGQLSMSSLDKLSQLNQYQQ